MPDIIRRKRSVNQDLNSKQDQKPNGDSRYFVTKVNKGEPCTVNGPVQVVFRGYSSKTSQAELLFICPKNTMVSKKGLS